MTTTPFTRMSTWTPLVVVVLAAFIFDQLFFDRSLGVNMLLFDLVIMAAVIVRIGWRKVSIQARGAGLAALISSAMIVVHNSTIACVMSILSLILFAAFAHEPALRTLPYAFLQSFANYLSLPMAMLDGTGDLVRGHGSTRTGWRWGRLAFVPVAVAFIFFQLYRVGNPKFDHLTAGFMDEIWRAISNLFEWAFTPHAWSFFLGALICAGLLFRYASRLVPQWESTCSELLVRVRRRRPQWMRPRAMDPLERERRMGMVLLVLVNALLCAVNIIDIDWVWFDFTVPQDFSLKQFVHEGTWVLIISILLSMLLILHLFRGNQNFYWRSIWLKRMALLWVGQNVILGISVFLRNYHYISFHGLAYKRIGVIVFLLLVVVGLFTLFVKVQRRRSLFYLARVNTWAALVVLTGLTLVDWDSFIVRSNLRHSNPGEIDIDNYLAMSDKVLPLLYENLDLVEQQMARHRENRVRWVSYLEPQAFRAALDAKRDRFLQRSTDQHWQEWNLADRRTLTALLAQLKPSEP